MNRRTARADGDMSWPPSIQIPTAGRAVRCAGPGWAMLLALSLMLCACAGTPESGTVSAMAPSASARSIHLLAADTFGALLDRLEPMFEREHPGVDLVVRYGVSSPPLDARPRRHHRTRRALRGRRTAGHTPPRPPPRLQGHRLSHHPPAPGRRHRPARPLRPRSGPVSARLRHQTSRSAHPP